MKKINLTEFLKSLGSEILTDIYGKEKLQIIIDTLDISVSENTIVNLLKSRYGYQILSNQKLRAYIFGYLSNGYLSYLIDGNYDEKSNITRDQKANLIKTNWNRNTKAIQRLIEIFDLDEDYLPSKIIKKESSFTIKPDFRLFPHQQRVKDTFVKNLREKKLKMIINMPTGAGKTRTSIEGLVDYWRSLSNKKSFVVWMAHSEELCEQAVETINSTWKVRGEENLNVYRLWGNHTPEFSDEDNGFIITSFQKIYSMINTSNDEIYEDIIKIKSKCFAIVVDEAHKSIAETYQRAINYITNLDKTYLIGLSATPGRGWNNDENKKLAEFYDNRLITITDNNDRELDDPVRYLQKEGFLAYVKTEEVKSDVTVELNDNEKNYLHNYFDLSEKFISKLGENQNRNLCILTQIMKYYYENKSIIVFACSLEHSNFLNEMCSQKNIKCASIDKETSPNNRRKYIEQYKNKEIRVLFNYGVLTHGFDAPNTEVVIIARPTQSPILYNQMIGRGLRGPKVGGNEECILVDIKDNIVGLPNERGTFIMYRDNYSK